MQILKRETAGPTESTYVLVFGLGLIGSAISNALKFFGFNLQNTLYYDWGNPEEQTNAFGLIRVECTEKSGSLGRLAVVWAAGDTAFHSSSEETNRELESFSHALHLIGQLVEVLKPAEFEFHLLSSAGGLFEGQEVVTLNSEPTPVRPYGKLKLCQELALTKAFPRKSLAFYRPSSVYGPMPAHSRKGLINNLIRNGYSSRTTVLDAQVMALRDYVFSQDIGDYIARLIRAGAISKRMQPEHFLVSARCSSIFEVVKKVESNFKIRLRIRFDQNFGNNKNITFSDHVLPPLWKPVPLDVGLKQFFLKTDAPPRTRMNFC